MSIILAAVEEVTHQWLQDQMDSAVSVDQSEEIMTQDLEAHKITIQCLSVVDIQLNPRAHITLTDRLHRGVLAVLLVVLSVNV